MAKGDSYGSFTGNRRTGDDDCNSTSTFEFSLHQTAGRPADESSSRESNSSSRWRAVVVEQLLLLLLIIGIGAGIGIGAALRSAVQPGDTAAVMYISFPGEVLMRMLKLLILPLIVSSLISAVASLDAKSSSKLALRALAFYFVTTLVAMAIGMVMVYLLQPGASAHSVSPTAAHDHQPQPSAIEPLLDLIRNMFPENIIEACFRSTQSKMVRLENNGTVTYQLSVEKVDGSSNVLGLVVYSLTLGCVLMRLGPAGKSLVDLMLSLQEATMLMVTLAIWYSPIGITSLVAGEIVRMADPLQSLQQLGLYLATVLSGLAIHGLVLLPLLYLVVTRKNPFTFLANTSQAMATAFGTSSSSATLPITYKCLEETVGIDKRVTRFILPIGATVNMNGTALYEAVAPIFIAQLNGMELNFGQLIAISLTATCAAVGAAGIPQAGLVTMVVVLNAVGLPTTDIAKIFTVDWLLDRFRTMINVLGDCFGAAVVEHLSSRDLSHSWADAGHEEDFLLAESSS